MASNGSRRGAAATKASDSAPVDPLDSPRKYWDEQSLGDPSRFMAMIGMMRLSRRTTATVDDVLRDYGLVRNAYLLLLSLQLTPKGSRNLGHLARDLLVHPTTVTLTIDKFEEEGLVSKSPDDRDRRVTRVNITAAGRDLVSKVTAELAEVGFGLDGLTDAQTAKLNSALTAARLAVGDIVK
jgi:DNA-binding MarR family transcriptional regulator